MAINEIRNAVCQRMPDVVRESTIISYNNAIAGVNGGINMMGSSMNLFMGDKVLPELLSLGKIGVFVDMPSMIGPTIADKGADRPYLYAYKAEQIRTWTYDTRQPDKLLAVLLEDANYVYDDRTGLTMGTDIVYRHLWIENGRVNVQFYDSNGDIKLVEPTILDLEQIPFVILELPDSLLIDVADYQIALLNLESSDLAYILKSNYPFYTEQFDPRSESPYIKQPGINSQIVYEDHNDIEVKGIVNKITYDNVQEIETGSAAGRRYPINTERPGFINPSSEPLTISMAKSDQLKRDIRLLVNLAVSDLGRNNSTSGSYSSLEAGLAIIGLKCETLERRIGELWSMYEGYQNPPHISYPTSYSLKTDKERLEEAKELEDHIDKIPSKTYQKEVAKQIAEITIGHKIPSYILQKIKQEIDDAAVVVTNPDVINTDIDNGLVSNKTASIARGYAPGEVDQAAKDHEARILRIALAQSRGGGAGSEANIIQDGDARGVPDLSTDKKAAEHEKKESLDKTLEEKPGQPKIRGEGK